MLDKMLQNIMEQPEALAEILRLRIDSERGTARIPGLEEDAKKDLNLPHIRRIIITGCGSSWIASVLGEYLIEEYARIPVEVEYASEFRYRCKLDYPPGTLVIAVSQSGENPDTLETIIEVKRCGAICVGICNVVDSLIARETDGGVYLHTGPEINWASTKAFTAQITVFDLIAILLGRMRIISLDRGLHLLQALKTLPQAVRQVLALNDEIQEIAKQHFDKNHCLFLGRGNNFPVALEGALKFKEVCGIHAEGYPAAEMKHGPIALIDKEMPVVVLAPLDSMYGKIESNLQESKTRQGIIIAVTTEGNTKMKLLANETIYLPKVDDLIVPQLETIALQLLAYHVAVQRQLNGIHLPWED